MLSLRQAEERFVVASAAEHSPAVLNDMEVVMGHSDRVIVMAQGTVIADGKPEEVRKDEGVIDAYLGGAA